MLPVTHKSEDAASTTEKAADHCMRTFAHKQYLGLCHVWRQGGGGLQIDA